MKELGEKSNKHRQNPFVSGCFIVGTSELEPETI